MMRRWISYGRFSSDGGARDSEEAEVGSTGCGCGSSASVVTPGPGHGAVASAVFWFLSLSLGAMVAGASLEGRVKMERKAERPQQLVWRPMAKETEVD